MRATIAAALMLLTPLSCFAVGTITEDVRISVRYAPIPVMANGKLQVVYELHVENQGDSPLRLGRLSVSRTEKGSSPEVVYEGQTLLDNTMYFDNRYRAANRDYVRDPDEDPDTIGPDMVGVVFLWITRDPPVRYPSNWIHELTFRRIGPEIDDGEDVTMVGGTFTLSRNQPVRIGPPLKGGPWWSMESMSNHAVHRRAMVLEMPFIAQRFGVDYIKLGENGKAVAGEDIADLQAWYGYGQDVIAVADGVVTDVNDGVPDNVPGSPEKAVAIATDTINGNYVVLDFGAGHRALYAHLARDSVQVSLGDLVRKGEVLGKVGNSGNSHGAHLHFHVSAADHAFDAEGLPYVYEQFRVVGVTSLQELQSTGFVPAESADQDVRHDEIPYYSTVVVYPDN